MTYLDLFTYFCHLTKAVTVINQITICNSANLECLLNGKVSTLLILGVTFLFLESLC
jgi:hypothetical protein